MTRLLVILIFGSMFAASSAAAQQIYNGLWVVNSERPSCNAACRDRYPVVASQERAGPAILRMRSSGCGRHVWIAAKVQCRGNPNTCKIHDGDGYIAAEDFSCYCVLVPPPDQK